jgi:hypothetical protein
MASLVFISAIAPAAIDHGDVEAKALHHVYPQVAEQTITESDDLVTGRQGVGECCLPAARACAWEEEGSAFFALEEPLGILHTVPTAAG